MDSTAQISFSIPAALKWIVAFAVGLLTGVPSLIWVLAAFMVIDYATGVGAAYVNHRLCSEEGFRGLIKKIMALLFVLAVHLFEHLSDLTLHAGGTDLHLDQAAAILLIFNEFISLIENCAEVGVPIPVTAVKFLQRFKKVYDLRPATGAEIRALRDRKEDE